MIRHHRVPVLEPLPLWVVPDMIGRLEEGIGIDQAAAANADAVEDERLPQQAHSENPTATEIREPEGFADVPVGARKISRSPPFALFEDRDGMAFLSQTVSGDGTSEP